MADALHRWPSAGLAAAIVRDGSLAWFMGHGVADAESKEPIMEDTAFRIGSITKTFTAIAVMQLWERGLVDLDAPVAEYLRSFKLSPASRDFRPVTVRHLLTHTAGIGYWRRLSDLLRPGIGSGDRAGRTVPSLGDYYGRGLPVEVEPGTKWVYSNHGFAVLGQVIEDLTGQPIDRYLRDNVFGPLGMEHTDLTPSERVRPGVATGYVLRSNGLTAVTDRAVVTAAAGAAYSTPADLACYVGALLNRGSNQHGSILQPDSVALMWQPQLTPDPRVAGMGLAFHLDHERGHRTVGHTGVVSGFLSAMLMAPDDETGVVVLGNTGGLDARGAPDALSAALLRRALGLPSGPFRTDIPPRPDTWGELCGWYSPPPGPVTNLFARATMGAGVEITVRGRHLLMRPLTPVFGLRSGLRLYPDDPDDPWVFRADFSTFGYAPMRVVFTCSGGTGAPIIHLDVGGMSFDKRPDFTNPRRWITGALATGAAALAIRRGRRRARPMFRETS